MKKIIYYFSTLDKGFLPVNINQRSLLVDIYFFMTDHEIAFRLEFQYLSIYVTGIGFGNNYI